MMGFPIGVQDLALEQGFVGKQRWEDLSVVLAVAETRRDQ